MKDCFYHVICCLVCRREREYLPQRTRLRRAGLSESRLRKMAPDDRVALLEKASLDPYDYIFLSC